MKRIVLLGGGHAHVHVLQALAREPIPGAELLLVTPFARQMYSGMVPGLVAGHYAVDQCAIPLTPLAQAAQVPLRETQAVALDAGHPAGKALDEIGDRPVVAFHPGEQRPRGNRQVLLQQRLDQHRGDPAQSESAHRQPGPVRDVRHRFGGARDDLVHACHLSVLSSSGTPTSKTSMSVANVP